ncbi:MAG: von Willebrand factor type A domain-containing protein [Alphaproteobacteria bacterium]|nr:von Willebrand factor type A domain-containing protein [Alphaproteobacteria bacterium]
MSRSRLFGIIRPTTLGGLAAMGVLGAVIASAVLSLGAEPAPAPQIEGIPDRFAEILLRAPPSEARAPEAAPRINPDAGEGHRAKKEEGKVGRKDAKMEKAKGNAVEVDKRQLDREIAENAGVLGALREGGEMDGVLGSSGLSSDVSGGIGGLIGAKGTQIGSGGLGSRGTGLGGGGTAAGIGGLGTHGRGGSVSGGSAGYGGSAYGSAAYGGEVTRFPPPRAQGSEHYTDYGVNEMTLTEKDRLSTFSIDVDKASYSIARRKLQSGGLPPAASVRVEEFVNYFDYAYEPPPSYSDAPFAVYMEAAPSPFDDSHHLLRVGVKGKEIDDSERKPARLTFLVDVSGSMSSPDKIGLVKQSLHELVENLGPEDSVAIATYAGRHQIVLEPTSARHSQVIHTAIDGLNTGGGTSMGTGMLLAYQMASEAYVSGAENRVIVLSDGDANIGQTSHTEILSTIDRYAKEGITMSTIGFGMGNYKDTMMEQLANKGDGNYFYVDSKTEAERVFGRDLQQNMITIARDVKIQVEFNPEAVMAYRLVGYENRDIADKDFRNDQVDAGEIGAGHSVTALYDVILWDDAPGELATVRLRAKPPGPDAPAQEWATLFSAGNLHGELADASDSFRLAVASATFAELLRGSPYAQEISYGQVWSLANGAHDPTSADQRELLDLIETAATRSGSPVTVARR